jgi:transposase
MEEQRLICGIDVSKDSLSFCYNQGKKMCPGKVKNNKEGHTKLFKLLKTRYTYVMESTGLYSLKLNCMLKKQGADVRVANAVIIKRYIQMNMGRHKSDKIDAKWILKYGLSHEAPVWQMPTKLNLCCTQLLSNIDFYSRHSASLQNYLHSLELYPFVTSQVERSCRKTLESIENDIKKMEEKLDLFLSKRYGELKKNLSTIPGLGDRAISYLLVLTNGFKKFQTCNQLIAFAGLALKERSSGTMEGRKKICKMGNRNLRKTLFMCTLSAIRFNKSCKDKFARMKERGKGGDCGRIAICIKLLKQAFAVAKKGIPYQEGHISERVTA